MENIETPLRTACRVLSRRKILQVEGWQSMTKCDEFCEAPFFLHLSPACLWQNKASSIAQIKIWKIISKAYLITKTRPFPHSVCCWSNKKCFCKFCKTPKMIVWTSMKKILVLWTSMVTMNQLWLAIACMGIFKYYGPNYGFAYVRSNLIHFAEKPGHSREEPCRVSRSTHVPVLAWLTTKIGISSHSSN